MRVVLFSWFCSSLINGSLYRTPSGEADEGKSYWALTWAFFETMASLQQAGDGLCGPLGSDQSWPSSLSEYCLLPSLPLLLIPQILSTATYLEGFVSLWGVCTCDCVLLLSS